MNLRGRYRCELRIETDGTGMSVRLAAFDQSLRAMGGAGLALAPGLANNPNSSVAANPDDRYTLRSAFVVNADAGATKELLTANVAAFLNGAGMRGLGTNQQLASALLGCRRGGVACLSVTSTAARSAPSGTRATPVAPVPLSLPERVASGPVVQASDPSQVGTTPRVVSADTGRDLFTWIGTHWLLALGVGGLAVAAGVYFARKGKRRG